ncbi:hypothetical protein [Paenibacillus sp. 22594]|uniref:hypothetical protein n=1 Tax=Paenibacillus sp. 22594 TaxID=3453947 RepID=UPI003F87DA36
MACVADDFLNDWWGDLIMLKDKQSKSSSELIDLMRLLRQAIEEKKYVIHYGV